MLDEILYNFKNLLSNFIKFVINRYNLFYDFWIIFETVSLILNLAFIFTCYKYILIIIIKKSAKLKKI